MYCQFFGLSRNPFSMSPDPDFLFLTPQNREALAGLSYAILGQKGFMVLTGEVGTGKTTLLKRALQYLPASRIQSSVILNPTLTPAEFLEMTLLDFGISDVPASKPQRLAKLQALLLQADRQNRISALIVDEAHKLSPDVLEEIRLLGNFEERDHKLLQILLLGQSELADLLNRPDLRQLKQRIAARFTIGPLAATDVEPYMRYRWIKAGGTPAMPFAPESLAGITRVSRGIPRVINAICDNALLLAFGESARFVTARHIQEACTDLDLVAQPDGPLHEVAMSGPVPPAIDFAPRRLERRPAPIPSRPLVVRWAYKLGLLA